MSWLEWHHAGVLTSLLELQEDQAFADVTLGLRDGKVSAVRPLVAALSPVFRSLLTRHDGQNARQPVSLETISTDCWHCVLSFYYSDRKLVTADNVEEMIAIADKYELTHLKNHCDVVLADCVNKDNCIRLLKIAYRYKLHSSSSKITLFVGESLDEVRHTGQLGTLGREELLALLECPALVAGEDSLCSAVLGWLDAVHVEQDTAVQVLSQLRLSDLSTDCIYRQLMYHPHVVGHDPLKKEISKELQKRLSSPSGQESAFACRKRDPRALEVTVVFGHDGKDMQVVYVPSGRTEWRSLPTIKVMDHFASHVLDGFVMVTGGNSKVASTHIFYFESKAWSTGPDLVNGRHAHGMTSVGTSLYVVAGSDNKGPLSSIEEYTGVTEQWTTVGNLFVATVCCGVAAVGEKIVVLGGLENDSGDLIQTFDVATCTAAVLESRLTSPMTRARGVTYEDTALFLGEDGDLVSVRDAGKSVQVSAHVKLVDFGQRSFFGLSCDGSRVWLYGGTPFTTAGTHVICYDLLGQRVTEGPSLHSLPVALRVHGVFTIRLHRK